VIFWVKGVGSILMKMNKSIAELREMCQYSYPDWDSQPRLYFYIRKVSIYLTWILVHLPISANQVSLLMIITGLCSSVLFACNYLIAAIFTLQICILLDFCDGEVARYRNQHSIEGMYLDQIFHFCVHPSIFAGIAIGVNNIHPSTWIIVAGFICAISIFADVMIKEYAKVIVSWIYSRRLLNNLNAALEVYPKDKSLFIDLLNRESHSQTSINSMNGRTKHSNLTRIFKSMISTWGFPNVFIVITVVVLIQLFIPMVCIGDACFTPLELILLFYAITYPFSIISFLCYNVARRRIGRDYDSFVQDLLLLLKKTSKIDIGELIKHNKF
jgi:CDP-alcohol phosphatidyltransferase-like enzyme